MKHLQLLGISLILVIGLATIVRAQAPRVISYQGLLTDVTNGPVADGAYNLTLKLYDQPTGGTALWTENASVTTTHGVFATALGSATPFPSSLMFGAPYYLGIAVQGGAELSPRTPLLSSPYAIHAEQAALAEGLTTNALGIVTSVNKLSGSLRLVGAGSTTVNTSGNTFTISSTGGAAGWNLTGNAATSPDTNFIGTTDAQDFLIKTSAVERARITSLGNFGIGTLAPNERLDVAGNVKFSGTLMPNSQAGTSGQILTSQGSSMAPIWTTPPSSLKPWALIGNAGTVYGTNFIGTTDSVNLQIRANNVQSGLIEVSGNSNTGFGYGVLSANTTGFENTASGYKSLSSNTTGNNNTASGDQSLFSNTTGYFNTASGVSSLYANTTGSFNTASGVLSLFSNTTGSHNTASGYRSLVSNTTGYDNTASGYLSLYSNTTGYSNTASGLESLYANTTGLYNTASGYRSLKSNTTGYYNTAGGVASLSVNTTGFYNTASGYLSLSSNTTGYYNTASGVQSLYANTTGSYNTASGYLSLYSNATGSLNTALGHKADVGSGALTNATAIGANAIVRQSNAVILGSNADVGIRTGTPRAELDVVGTRGIVVPVGTTAQRPASPAQGTVRYNTTTSKFEGYNGAAWVNLN